MDNPFKKILRDREVPEILKKRVLNDIDKIKLTLDLADLFIIKFPSTMGDLLGREKGSSINEES